MRRLSGTWLAFVLAHCMVTNAAEGARAQVDPLILHSAIECWPQTEFVILRAVFQPGLEIATAKAYFRSNMYPDFYYVDLAVQPNGQGEAILPKPGPETTSVIYYLEAVTRTYASARSAEWSATVADPDTCKRRYPAGAWFQGDSPNIVVGATRFGAAAIPPGFQAQGITGFVNASGIATGAGGGFGTGATIAAIGGAAAGLGVLGAAAGGNDSTTTTVAAAPSTTTTTAPATTVPGSAPLACFTTQPSPPTIFENESIRFDASCSRADALTLDTIVNYYWDFGNGKIVEGPDRRVVNTLFTTPGTYTALLIVQDEAGNRSQTSSGVTVRTTPPPTTTTIGIQADLSVDKSAPATAFVASPLDYKLTVVNAGPSPATNVQLTDTLPNPLVVTGIVSTQGSCAQALLSVTCSLGTVPQAGSVVITISTRTPQTPVKITNTATVSATEPDPSSSNNKDSVDTNIIFVPLIAESVVEASVGSDLEGASEARFQLNDAAFEAVHGARPERIRLSARPGVNVISAEVLAKTDGSWTFDFSGTPRFVPGSIEVDSGDVLSLTATSVVFGVREGAPTRARFRFRLSP